MTIAFSGGGTLGSVTPLLAIHDMVREQGKDTHCVWFATKSGPERGLVEDRNIRVITLASGKYRRYLSLWNIIDIARIVAGFFQALFYLSRERPDVCISAGGFISVPVHAAARLLHIPTWVHLQDVTIGLANRLMLPTASVVTTSLEKTAAEISPPGRALWLGNPVRPDIGDGIRSRAKERLGLASGVPVVLVTGGGTGSLRVNQLTTEAVPLLEGRCHVIHLTGADRPKKEIDRAKELFPWYHPHAFFGVEMKDAYAAADVVVSRAGFGTVSELASQKKACILIPKPGHQEENARFAAEKGAAVVLNELTSDGNLLAKTVLDMLENHEERDAMGQRLHALLPPAKKDQILKILGYFDARKNHR